MAIEDELRERLRKVEALFFGATTVGEREAAGAAAERLKAKLAEASRLDPPVHFEKTTERLIREGIHTDTADAELAPDPIGLR